VGTTLVVALISLFLGAVPGWPHSCGWGFPVGDWDGSWPSSIFWFCSDACKHGTFWPGGHHFGEGPPGLSL